MIKIADGEVQYLELRQCHWPTCFLDQQVRQFISILDDDICHCGKHRAARLWRRIAPCRKRLRGCRNSPVDVSGGGIGHFGGNRLVAGVYDLHGARAVRSEEHTSELQSLMRISYAVFCLKNKKIN